MPLTSLELMPLDMCIDAYKSWTYSYDQISPRSSGGIDFKQRGWGVIMLLELLRFATKSKGEGDSDQFCGTKRSRHLYFL
jgi:hypothetical protein